MKARKIEKKIKKTLDLVISINYKRDTPGKPRDVSHPTHRKEYMTWKQKDLLLALFILVVFLGAPFFGRLFIP